MSNDYVYNGQKTTIDNSSFEKALKDYNALKSSGKKAWLGLEITQGNKLQLKAVEVGFWEKVQKFFGCGGWDRSDVSTVLASTKFDEELPAFVKTAPAVAKAVSAVLPQKEPSAPAPIPKEIAAAQPIEPKEKTTQADSFPKVSFDDWKRDTTNAKIGTVRLQSPSGQAFLTLAKGDVTQKHGVDVQAAMNAANAGMEHGWGGTNAAYSKVIPKEHWGDCVNDLKKSKNFTKLEIAECVVMPWPEKPNAIKKDQINPQHLLHVLGPIPTDTKKLDLYQIQVYEGFKNLFGECQKLKVDSIQITGLSTGIFCKDLPDKERLQWLEKADQALFQAMNEAMSDGSIKEIVLVDFVERPWGKYVPNS